jgi:hypothetical protein
MATKTDVFEDSLIRVEHTYANQVVKSDTVQTASVRIINKTTLPLTNVKIAIDLDDDGRTWDADVCDESGKLLNPQALLRDVPDLAAGASYEFKYYWKTQYIFGPRQGAFNITFNIMPHYEVHYGPEQAFDSEARVINSSGTPGTCWNWKEDVFKDPAIQIKHDFWGDVCKFDGGWVTGTVSITNTTKLPLKGVAVVVDLDDDADAYKAVRCTSGGQVMTEQEAYTPLPMGDIQPNGTSTVSYWWKDTRVPGSPDADASQDFTATLNIIPGYQVEYSKSDAFKSNGKAVDPSA